MPREIDQDKLNQVQQGFQGAVGQPVGDVWEKLKNYFSQPEQPTSDNIEPMARQEALKRIIGNYPK